MNVDRLMGVAIVWGFCTLTWAIFSHPVTAQTQKVEAEPTAYVHDGTLVYVGDATVTLKLVRFRDGVVCVVGNSRYSGRIQLDCDFSNSSLVHNK